MARTILQLGILILVYIGFRAAIWLALAIPGFLVCYFLLSFALIEAVVFGAIAGSFLELFCDAVFDRDTRRRGRAGK